MGLLNGELRDTHSVPRTCGLLRRGDHLGGRDDGHRARPSGGRGRGLGGLGHDARRHGHPDVANGRDQRKDRAWRVPGRLGRVPSQAELSERLRLVGRAHRGRVHRGGELVDVRTADDRLPGVRDLARRPRGVRRRIQQRGHVDVQDPRERDERHLHDLGDVELRGHAFGPHASSRGPGRRLDSGLLARPQHGPGRDSDRHDGSPRRRHERDVRGSERVRHGPAQPPRQPVGEVGRDLRLRPPARGGRRPAPRVRRARRRPLPSGEQRRDRLPLDRPGRVRCEGAVRAWVRRGGLRPRVRRHDHGIAARSHGGFGRQLDLVCRAGRARHVALHPE